MADEVNDLGGQAGASCFVLVRRPGKLAVVLAYGDENGQFPQARLEASRVAQVRIDGPQSSGHPGTVQPQPARSPQTGEGPTVRVAQQVERLLAGLVEVVAVWERQPAVGLGIDIGRQRLGVHGGLSLKRLCSIMPKRVGRTAPRLGAFQEHCHPHGETAGMAHSAERFHT